MKAGIAEVNEDQWEEHFQQRQHQVEVSGAGRHMV